MDVTQLIAGLQQGNPDAFRHLVETYQNRVYNTVLSIVRQPAVLILAVLRGKKASAFVERPSRTDCGILPFFPQFRPGNCPHSAPRADYR